MMWVGLLSLVVVVLGWTVWELRAPDRQRAVGTRPGSDSVAAAPSVAATSPARRIASWDAPPDNTPPPPKGQIPAWVVKPPRPHTMAQ